MAEPASVESFSRLDWHLENWAAYMRASGLMGMMPHGCLPAYQGSRDVEEMEQEADFRCARVVEAIVDGLSPVDAAALSHRYLHAVYRFPRITYQQALERARAAVARGLAKRGVW